MVSLCQFVLVAVGAWVALRLDYATSLPFPLLILLAGLITGVLGTLIGLPALRLSGLYLALITLMAAGGLTVVLKIAQFPNGGGGFFGNSRAGGATSKLPRPSIAQGDIAYYRYCVAVAGLMFLVALWHVRSKPGRAWAAVRQSEFTAIAAGVHTTLFKLWAFALASFMAGVAGALLAAATGGVNINQFPVQNSILLLAVTLMGGVFSLWGAVVAALFQRGLPAFLDYNWGVSTEWLTILFGIGVIQVLLTAPGGLAEQFPKDMARLGRGLFGLVKKAFGGGKQRSAPP
jgi:branched-chain amino acid transport system permease protein